MCSFDGLALHLFALASRLYDTDEISAVELLKLKPSDQYFRNELIGAALRTKLENKLWFVWKVGQRQMTFVIRWADKLKISGKSHASQIAIT